MNIIQKINTVSAMLTAARALAEDAAGSSREHATWLYRRALLVLEAAQLIDEDLDLAEQRMRLAMSYRSARYAVRTAELRELMLRDAQDQLAQYHAAHCTRPALPVSWRAR